MGLLLGGALTEYLSWRWTLYVNLLFAGVAFTGGALLLKRQPSLVKPRLDVPGALLVSSAVFCLVYGLSNAATQNWRTPSTYGFLATGVVLMVVFALWQGRAARPLLPPRVVLNRNRGGAYLSLLIGTAGLFGILLSLTYSELLASSSVQAIGCLTDQGSSLPLAGRGAWQGKAVRVPSTAAGNDPGR